MHAFLTAEEKGIDVRIAIDIIRLAHRGKYDVALLFSQDQDLSELCAEIRTIAKEQARRIKIDRATFDKCLDPRDYRPKASRP
ncbi:MAG: NYN domain-containing protein [Acidobacteria bacterium]|nr:NYN domain-containing protein [Acidobacteriota bacterium]